MPWWWRRWNRTCSGGGGGESVGVVEIRQGVVAMLEGSQRTPLYPQTEKLLSPPPPSTIHDSALTNPLTVLMACVQVDTISTPIQSLPQCEPPSLPSLSHFSRPSRHHRFHHGPPPNQFPQWTPPSPSDQRPVPAPTHRYHPPPPRQKMTGPPPSPRLTAAPHPALYRRRGGVRVPKRGHACRLVPLGSIACTRWVTGG